MDDVPLREFALLNQLQSQLSSDASVLLGIGDDAAILNIPPGHNIVVAADLMVENVHFDLQYTPAESIGHKLLAVNLSDLAAMGAKPRWALVSMALPLGTSQTFIKDVYLGLSALAEEFGVRIVGGDTTRAKRGCLTFNLSLLGTQEAHGTPLTRKGAQVGDHIYLCGELGGAAYALQYLEKGEIPDSPHLDWQKPLFFPTPYTKAGEYYYKHAIASAMIDVSDGLLSDLDHLLRRGDLYGPRQLGACLFAKHLPLAAPLRKRRRSDLALAVNGGEDYALLLTVPPHKIEHLQKVDAPDSHFIGSITETPTINWKDLDGAQTELGSAWRHFDYALDGEAP